MPRVQRSPPQSADKLTTKSKLSPTHYGSDSDTNLSSIGSFKQDSNLNITKRIKRRLAVTPSNSDELIREFRAMYEKLHSQQESKFLILNASISSLIEQNTEIKKSIEFMSSQYDAVISKIETLEAENQKHKTYIKTLETKLNLLEKDSKSSSIELRNIPQLEPENKQSLSNTIKTLATVIDADPIIQESEIRNIYRSKTQAIIVEFTTTFRRESLIQKFHEYNKVKRQNNQRPLGTSALKISGPEKTVFLSEALTSKARRIYFLTRELVKNKKLFATWISYGRVFIRKEEGKPATRVNDESELQTFF